MERPKPELTEDGRQIIYTIWRPDLAEVIIQNAKINRSRATVPDTEQEHSTSKS